MVKRDGRKLDHKTLEELRFLAVRRVNEGGEKPSEVARSMGFCRTALYPWLRKARKHGLGSLGLSKASGPVPKLTAKQCAQVRKWIVGNDPRQYGFEFGLWTRQIVAELIATKFGVTMTLAGVGKLLARLDITPQRPLRRAYERDERAVEQWKQETYPELRKRARRHGAEIFFLDEAGFTSEPNLGRTYGQRGRTPVVRTTGKRQKINAISAVNAKGAFWSQVYTGNFNATRFVEFLKDFMKRRKRRVFLVVDGHPSHRAKMVARHVQECKGRLELHFLPPYAPDLNPDEFVWQYAKTNGLAKKPLRRDESLKQRVQADMAFIKENPKLVRSFFMAPSVVYASF